MRRAMAFAIGLGMASVASATASLPCSGERHGLLIVVGHENEDQVHRVTLYNSEDGGVLQELDGFTHSQLVWSDYSQEGRGNRLHLVRDGAGVVSMAIAVEGAQGTLTLDGASERIHCNWLR